MKKEDYTFVVVYTVKDTPKYFISDKLLSALRVYARLHRKSRTDDDTEIELIRCKHNSNLWRKITFMMKKEKKGKEE